MTREFAEAVAFMIRADIYVASIPAVVSGIGDGRDLSFSDKMVLLGHGDAPGLESVKDAVFLDRLATQRDAAEKLAGWLGTLLGGDSGVMETSEGWSAWAAREDGAVFAVTAAGYRLYPGKDDYVRGEPVKNAALREPGAQGGAA